MEDTKTFRVRQLQHDCSIIGTVLKALEFLRPRYPEICDATNELLMQLKVLLVADGIAGYLPKVEVVEAVGLAAELAVKVKEDEEIVRVEELAKEAQKAIDKALAAVAKAAKIAKLKEDIKELEV